MICILAGNRLEAQQWASSQNLDDSEWFYPNTPNDIRGRVNFHVIVVGSAGHNVPPYWFEQVYSLAKSHGRKFRM